MHPEETRIFYATLIGAGVLAMLVVFFVVTILRHQRRKMELERQQLVSEILLLETERGRIAADLHDELGSLVSAIKLNMQCLNTADPEDADILERTGGYIDTTMQKIREISNNLMPKSLQKKGLVSAIREFTDMIGHSGSLKLRFDASPELIRMPAENEIHVYRVVQEITNNALKHANAAHIQVTLRADDKKLHLLVSDDGQGFHTGEAGKKQGHGLQNIMRRVDMLQGSIYLESQPGAGTQYTIEIPL
ncbi:sensor histidine kinase [Sediminibacterium soli]|uniref:sensor histidine kinase n=1 Tax=Sediminibacterium soli TaxID=2698829 RepID=UPI00137B2767|nr:sensor histidine kinase [Sediminibacterium soli]NCI46320.1 sensor histidine kinase [Sediminibacterium soli]